MSKSDFEMMLDGYGMTTAELFYRMPNHQSILQTYVWQHMDLAPNYPKLFEFVEFWKEKIVGPLHSVRFFRRKLISPGEWRNVTGEFHIH